MSQITINSVTGLNPPYQVYACNIFGLSCTFIATITNPVPSSVTITLPSPQFDTVPVVGIRIITSDGCERFEVVYCSPTPTPTCDYKQFQDDVCFEFMDDDPYYFQN